MFDPFFCDEINGFDVYSENPEDDPLYSNCESVGRNPRYIDRTDDRTTYDVYGIELRETKKAVLYQLVVEMEKGSYRRKFKLGPKKWLPKNYINATHVSEFDATDVKFKEEFVVTGIDNLHVISIPSWLHYKDPVLRKEVFSVRKFKC